MRLRCLTLIMGALAPAIALTASLLPAAPALAADPPKSAPAGSMAALVVQPEADQPRAEIGRGYFQLDVAPGQARTIRLVVKNTGDTPVPLRIDPVDGVQTAQGIDFGAHGVAGPGAGSWLSAEPARLALEPGEVQRVTATLRVPDTASAGDHVAGIAVEDERVQTQGGGTLLIDVHFRQVIAVVASTPVPAVSTDAQANGTGEPVIVRKVEIVPDGTGSRAFAELYNASPRLVRGSGQIVITGGAGAEPLPFTFGTILPGATSRIEALMPKLALQPGVYQVQVHVNGVLANVKAGADDSAAGEAVWADDVTVPAPEQAGAATPGQAPALPRALDPIRPLTAAARTGGLTLGAFLPWVALGLAGLVVLGAGVGLGLGLSRRSSARAAPAPAAQER